MHGLDGNAIDTFDKETFDPPVHLPPKPPDSPGSQNTGVCLKNISMQQSLVNDKSGQSNQNNPNTSQQRWKPPKQPFCMWPRDLLPRTTTFRDSRIMTFGYNSDSRDRMSAGGLESWSKNLLGELNIHRAAVSREI